MDIKYTILKAGIACLRGIYAPMKLQKSQNRITIISRQSRMPSVDIELLSREIRKQCPEIDCRIMVKFIEPGFINKIRYAFHVLKQMRAIASSKVVIIDGYCIAVSILKHKENTEIIQMWHSMAAIKKFGKQTVDKPSGHNAQLVDIMCMHRNYTHVICPSEKTGELFCQGFGCSSDKIVLLCLPRIDYIKKQCEIGKDCLPGGINDNSKEIILYAPTFRKNDSIKISQLFEAIDYEKFILVVKPHPLYEERFEDKIAEMGLEGKVIVDTQNDTFKWLGACDRVITDYSAVAVESLVTEKPLYFFAYDIDEYEKTTGLNVNPAVEVPSITARTGGELKTLLEKEYDYSTLNRFRDTYLLADTENCTEKLAGYIIGVANGNN